MSRTPTSASTAVGREQSVTPNQDLKVVVTMPAYHAAGTLQQTLDDLPAVLHEHVLLVDDASTDGTVEVARDLGLTVVGHEENRGYGGNQKTCYSTALDEGADIVVMLHPDYQYDPQAVPLLIAPLLSGDAEMTFGSRFAGMSQPKSGGMPNYRFIGNRITTTAQNLLLGTRFSELHSGMRAYSRDFLLSMPFLGFSDGFDFDAQMLCGAIATGHRVIEVPISTRYTSQSSSIGIGPSLHYVFRSVVEAGKATASAGRRGSRSKVASRGKEPKRLKALRPVTANCIQCGEVRHGLIHPADDDTLDTGNDRDAIVQCTSCRVVRAEPAAATNQAIDAREVADQDSDGDGDGVEGHRKLFEWVVDAMNCHYVPERRLIEFGSETGMFIDTARRGGWLARGVEPSVASVLKGKKRFGVALEQGTIEGVETPVDPYGAVVMLDMLDHTADPHAALASARRVCADEGLLVLSTTNLESVYARMLKERWPGFNRPRRWYYTPETLFSHLERAGFEPIAWHTPPNSARLSGLLGDGAHPHDLASRILGPVTDLADPEIPTAWLGDRVLVLARATD